MDPGPNHRDPMRESANGGCHLALGAVLQVRIGMLVSAERRRAFGVMRQPVLVGVHADQILEARGDPRFLVRLPLRQAEHHIALDGATGNQIFVASPAVMTIDDAGVIVRAIVVAGAGVIHEFAGLSQIEGDRPVGIRRKLAPLHDQHRRAWSTLPGADR